MTAKHAACASAAPPCSEGAGFRLVRLNSPLGPLAAAADRSAVGQANAINRVRVLVPCHRVIAKDGTLGGYSGGLWRKRRLLEIEGG